MKKLLALLACLALLTAGAGTALADEASWTPGNAFYTEHEAECLPSDKTVAPEEDLPLWYSPQVLRVSGTVLAGETARIYYTWTDIQGSEWGLADFWRGDAHVTGWTNLTDPASRPVHALQTAPVLVVSGLLAVAVIAILLVPERKKKGR